MRPPGPLPCTSRRSTPDRAAIFFARGEALTLPPGSATGTGASAGAIGRGARGGGGAAALGGGGGGARGGGGDGRGAIGNDRNHPADRSAPAGRHDDLPEDARSERFELDVGLVRLDLGDDLPAVDAVSFLLDPLAALAA